VQPDFETEPARLRERVPKEFPILLAAIRALRPTRVLAARQERSDVKNDGTGNARLAHRLKVFRDTLARNVRPHPVPPALRLVNVRRRAGELLRERRERLRAGEPHGRENFPLRRRRRGGREIGATGDSTAGTTGGGVTGTTGGVTGSVNSVSGGVTGTAD